MAYQDWGEYYTDEEREVFRSRRKERIDARRDLKDERVKVMSDKLALQKETQAMKRERLVVEKMALKLRREKLLLEKDSLERLKVLQAEYLSNEDLLKRHRELLYKVDENGEIDAASSLKALELAYKMKGLNAPNRVESKSVSAVIRREYDNLSDERKEEIDKALGVDKDKGVVGDKGRDREGVIDV